MAGLPRPGGLGRKLTPYKSPKTPKLGGAKAPKMGTANPLQKAMSKAPKIGGSNMGPKQGGLLGGSPVGGGY
jgi:hypothetical protein